jgi:hypothetical protein
MSSRDARQVMFVFRQPSATASVPFIEFVPRVHSTGIDPLFGPLCSAYCTSAFDATENPFSESRRSPALRPARSPAEPGATAFTMSPRSSSSVRPTFSGSG